MYRVKEGGIFDEQEWRLQQRALTDDSRHVWATIEASDDYEYIQSRCEELNYEHEQNCSGNNRT